MSDIFISYHSGDRPSARALAGALEDEGWSVFWDRKLDPGDDFEQFIQRELDAAACVIVLWSPASVLSNWVRNEAAYAEERGVMIPARIAEVDLPLASRHRHTADLTGWDGSTDAPAFAELVRGIRKRIGGEEEGAPELGAATTVANGAADEFAGTGGPTIEGARVPTPKRQRPVEREPRRALFELERTLTLQTPRENAYDAGVYSLAFSPDGTVLATGEAEGEAWYELQQSDGVVKLWDLATGDVTGRLAVEGDRLCRALTFVDNHVLAVASEGGTPGASSQHLRSWDLADGQVRTSLLDVDPVDGNGPIRFVGYSEALDRIVATGGRVRHDYASHDTPENADFRTWDGDGRLVLARQLGLLIRSQALSPDGRRIALGTASGPRILDLTDGQVLREFPKIGLDTEAVAFTPDGNTLVAAVSPRAGPRLLLSVDVESTDVSGSLEVDGDVRELVIDPGGKLACYRRGESVRIVQLADGAVLQEIGARLHVHQSSVFATNWRWLAVAVDAWTVEVYAMRGDGEDGT